MAAGSYRKLIVLAAIISSLLFVGVLLAVFYFVNIDQSIGNEVVRSQRSSIHAMPDVEWVARGQSASARFSPTQANELKSGVQPLPQNVVLIIGDGMGLGQISTASTLLFGPGGGLALETAKVTGLTRVWALDNLTVDSAAAGTAIATGFRTNKTMVGMLPDGRPVRNLLEAARTRGMATGVLTTSFLMDATPACFTAHAPNRNQYDSILGQMLESGTDILLGGSSKIPVDGEDGITSQIKKATDLGFTVVRNEGELADATGKILGLFPSRNGDPSFHGPPLETSVRKMLALLAEQDVGFVAVIESEITDAAGHSNDIHALVDGVQELDAATRVVLEFSELRRDTLVLIFADHATGVPAIVDGKANESEAEIRWLTTHHAVHWLPIFAFGPGSEAFSGVFDAAQVGPTIAALMGIEKYPAVFPEPE